jgi:hypothetical protein
MSFEASPGSRKLSTAQVAKRYTRTRRTIERWERDPNLNFPKPLVIRGRKYRDEAELEAWERARVVMTAT